MSVFRVHIPYVEKPLGAEAAREHEISYIVEGATWVEALSSGIQRFQDLANQDFHSWICQLKHDGVQVTEFETGKTFRLAPEGEIPPAGAAANPSRSPLADPARRAEAYAMLVQAVDGPPGGVADRVLASVTLAVDADASAVLLADPGGKELVFAAATGPKAEQVRRLRLPALHGVAGFCAKSGEAIAVDNAALTPLFDPEVSKRVGYPASAIAAAPVRRGRDLLGAIEVLNPRGRSAFTADDLSLLVSGGLLLGLALSPGARAAAKPVRAQRGVRPRTRRRGRR